jgi:hypothetical protein
MKRRRLLCMVGLGVPVIAGITAGAVAVVGCGDGSSGGNAAADQVAPHTRLWVDGGNTRVWTYQKVAERRGAGGPAEPIGRHYAGPIRKGEEYRLADGTLIAFDGTGLTVGGVAVPAGTLNVFVGDDGAVQLDAFIRTFK